MKFLVLNGPNLDKLGSREPSIYGYETLANIEEQLRAFGTLNNVQFEFRQTASEGDLVTLLNSSDYNWDGIILNPAAYTHYSVAIRDAIKCTSVPVVEVHLTNVFARESFRSQMVTTGSCIGQICGFGSYVYTLAAYALKNHIEKSKNGEY